MVFFTSDATTRNQTHLSSVAPLCLIQDALPTELPRPRYRLTYMTTLPNIDLAAARQGKQLLLVPQQVPGVVPGAVPGVVYRRGGEGGGFGLGFGNGFSFGQRPHRPHRPSHHHDYDDYYYPNYHRPGGYYPGGGFGINIGFGRK